MSFNLPLGLQSKDNKVRARFLLKFFTNQEGESQHEVEVFLKGSKNDESCDDQRWSLRYISGTGTCDCACE